MYKIIRELFSGNLFPAEHCGANNKEINDLTNALNVIFCKLKKSLGEEQELLERFEETSAR